MGGTEDIITQLDSCATCAYFSEPEQTKVYGVCELSKAMGADLSSARHPQDWCPDREEKE